MFFHLRMPRPAQAGPAISGPGRPFRERLFLCRAFKGSALLYVLSNLESAIKQLVIAAGCKMAAVDAPEPQVRPAKCVIQILAHPREALEKPVQEIHFLPQVRIEKPIACCNVQIPQDQHIVEVPAFGGIHCKAGALHQPFQQSAIQGGVIGVYCYL